MTVRLSFTLVAVLGLTASGCAGTRAASPVTTPAVSVTTDGPATTAVPVTTDATAPSALTPYPDLYPDFTTGTEPLPEVTDLPAPSTPSAGETVFVGVADYEQYPDLASLIRDASVVVSGRAGPAEAVPDWPYDVDPAGVTRVPFQVDRTLRGVAGGNVIPLIQPGGPGPDGVVRRMSGSEYYETGRCYVLFLSYAADDDVFYAVGGAPGCTTLRRPGRADHRSVRR